ncbi:Hypothetical protein R9X50_00309200 [Acrodontium crateriforme]|uniref:Protein farnesyltransferase subunit beta n=1 Tax=Acrodontium crateriforme TaxID=150365 RepID=A0AAQ3RBJ4_9PEZI|nr:Hypothetical protein R9X50_00309200 [Acrodontium crateriforme]
MRGHLFSNRYRRRVRFSSRKMAPLKDDPEDSLPSALKDGARIVELADDDGFEDDTKAVDGVPFSDDNSSKKSPSQADLPPWLQAAVMNLFHDDVDTVSSTANKETTASCLPILTVEDTQGLPLNSHGLPNLRRSQHIDFLSNTFEKLPAPYQVVDSSRPWLFYWGIAGLSSLGVNVTKYRDQLVETVTPLQNRTGGFGGGHGHMSHCACSYSTTLALAAVGGLDMIDRKAMWNWLGSLKQIDGGFRMAIGAEEDIRGAYCAMTIITILNLPLTLPPDASARSAGMELFTDGLGEWIGRCQTYEGGIAAAPNNEAHGAYAFCGLACLSILDAPHISIPKYLNVRELTRCLAGLQTHPEGGFSGRANKLVDACYSHWVGGCWALLEAAVGISEPLKNGVSTVSSLWSREGLIRYLLTCGQQPGKKGGMRDKPSARPDAYHTCYSLAGLSAAQNHYHYDRSGPTTDYEDANKRLPAAFNWSATRASADELAAWHIDEKDVVNFVHPVFVIPFQAIEEAELLFRDGGF